MSDSNVIEGRFPTRPPVGVKFEAPRRSLVELADLTRPLIRPKEIDTGEIVALSEALDDIAKWSRTLMNKTGRAAFGIMAQDAESMSERCVHLAAELGGISDET